ncbi:37S ribosomal protein S26, mitochondrial [Phlyctema vagabunda]|uniref:37S ribosomal protein S26, mitochondrial n=1 Tax=Phlyctema vagabunda TaxID=108571 RepID=A0ABR4PKQ9_9HELO
MLRPRLPRIALGLRRSLHQMPPLKHDFTRGVPGLLSADGFSIAWTEYQGLMLEHLNRLTVDTPEHSKSPKEVLLKYARDPNAAAIFNYASMAHNNAFFFQGLTPEPTQMPEALKKELENSFSSIDTLKRELIATANSMFGPGFVWVVKSKSEKYSILTTYLAGSPYPGAHFRKQPVDMNTENDADHNRRAIMDSDPVNTVGSHGRLSKQQPKLAPGGIDVIPVLCLNTWEHVYLRDYGVGLNGHGGKRMFADSWWETIDWAVVANHAQIKAPSSKRFQI